MIVLPNLAAMQQFARRIAHGLRECDTISLSGPLGAGKTTLARGILRSLGHEGEVPSPTYTIFEVYELKNLTVVHADFYRLTHKAELRELGFDDYQDHGVTIVEWPERVGRFDGPNVLSVQLEVVGNDRRAIVEAGPGWQGRLP